MQVMKWEKYSFEDFEKINSCTNFVCPNTVCVCMDYVCVYAQTA